MDEDVEKMSTPDLIAEVKKLRAGIRKHRDSTLHELCWHHPDLWVLLPEKTDPVPLVPEWPQFMRGCINTVNRLTNRAAICRELNANSANKAKNAQDNSRNVHQRLTSDLFRSDS